MEFCRRQYASEKQIYRVQLVLEEMLLNIILPQLEDGKIAVDVTVEYSVKDSRLAVFISSAEPFTLRESGEDDLSTFMLRAVCTDIAEEQNGVRLYL